MGVALRIARGAEAVERVDGVRRAVGAPRGTAEGRVVGPITATQRPIRQG